MNLLYVNEDLVDLDARQVIAITVKAIEVGKLDTRTVTHTNQFTVPHTANNDRIFGYVSSERSRSSIPYAFQSCKLIQNGIETITDGKLIIKGYDNSGFKLNIFENMFDIFANLEGKKLADINPLTNTAWGRSAMDTYRNSTDNLISAIIYWGKDMLASDYFTFFLPSFYYHTIVTSILENTGITLSGDLLTDDRFTDLVIPFPGDSFLYPSHMVDPYWGKAYAAEALTIGQVLTGTRVVQVDSYYYGEDFFLNSAYYFEDYNFNATVNVLIEFTSFTWNSATFMEVEIVKNGVTVLDNYTVAGGTGSTLPLTLTYTGDFIPGDYVYLNIRSDVASVPNGVNTTTAAGWYLQVIVNQVVNTALVYWNLFLPDILCKDLLSDFFTRFGIVPKQKGGTLYLKTLEAILTDRANAVDWSAKLVNSVRPMDFTLSYAQNNNFDYVDTVNDQTFGRGVMVVSNDTLPFERTEFTTVFENCEEYDGSGYQVASIPVFDNTSETVSEFVDAPGIKLLTLKARTTETSITFYTSPRTDYSLGYFVDIDLTKDTRFSYFLTQFYGTFIDALQKNKVIVKQYYLTPMDIKNFDSHKMIYDGDGYYYVNKISNFVAGRVTKVELFKIA